MEDDASVFVGHYRLARGFVPHQCEERLDHRLPLLGVLRDRKVLGEHSAQDPQNPDACKGGHKDGNDGEKSRLGSRLCEMWTDQPFVDIRTP